MHDRCDIVKYLVSKGAKIDKTGDMLDSALIFAAELDNDEIVACLVRNGANLEVPSKHGSTALNMAAGNGNLKMVKVLVENGANKNSTDVWRGRKPLMWECYRQ